MEESIIERKLYGAVQEAVNNKVGLTVSDSLDGGWTRMGADCVVKTATPASWGVGQPSVVSLDGAGKVALFYAGYYGTRMLTLDFGTSAAAACSLREHVGDEGTFVSTVGIGMSSSLGLRPTFVMPRYVFPSRRESVPYTPCGGNSLFGAVPRFAVGMPCFLPAAFPWTTSPIIR